MNLRTGFVVMRKEFMLERDRLSLRIRIRITANYCSPTVNYDHERLCKHKRKLRNPEDCIYNFSTIWIVWITWCIQNNLPLNTNKCNVVSYERKRNRFRVSDMVSDQVAITRGHFWCHWATSFDFLVDTFI